MRQGGGLKCLVSGFEVLADHEETVILRTEMAADKPATVWEPRVQCWRACACR